MGSVGNLKPLLLHAHPKGPNPIKVAILLEYLDLPYDIKVWNGSDDANKGVKGAKFFHINPNGRVPALEDPNTGVLAWESGAILNYLRREYDTLGKFGPRGSSKQDLVDLEKWEYLIVTTLGPMSGQVNWFRLYNKVKNDDAIARYQAQTLRCWGVLEHQLAQSDGGSIIPGGYCTVDFHLQPWIHLRKFAGLELDEYPLLKKWFDTLSEQEAVKRAYDRVYMAAEQQGIPAPS